MESYIPISFLNDFIFCPRSIYFHQLYGGYDSSMYQQRPQVAGKAAHTAIDQKKYSTRKNVLQGLEIYSEKYRLCGKIDIYDADKEKLWERKREIKTVYDGYIFQVYAQCFALREMGYGVKSIALYDLVDNTRYPIPLPENDAVMMRKFEDLVHAINTYDLDSGDFQANPAKCRRCIYSNLCDHSLC
ncbi:MAG: type V CRISPR-associated protein Cas4 [Bacteroidota bacterium]|nr:type V CRISPR-associated protein Cas4 [Bacteroidota bacterium]